jgi:hypothetical protein
MPFGKYKSFADCVAQNQDKRDPEAYCASIEQTVQKRRKAKRARTKSKKKSKK